MEITKIEISNYKSLKEIATIHFYKDMPTVLIGKNGSGKTNILEALENIYNSGQSYYYPSQYSHGLKYRCYIKLSKEDFKKLFSDKIYNEEKCFLIVSNNEYGLKAEKIQSDYIVPILKEKIEDILKITKKLKNVIAEYKKQIQKITYVNSDNIFIEREGLKCFEILDLNGNITNYNKLMADTKYKLEDGEKFVETILKSFSNKDYSVFDYTDNILKFDYTKDFKFELKYIEPDLSDFEKKFISIDREAIKSEIERINCTVKSCSEKITEYTSTINERINYFKNALSHEYSLKDEKKYFQLFDEIQSTIGKKCLFLKNESNNIAFFNKNSTDTNIIYRNKNTFSISQIYLEKIYNGNDKEERLKELLNKKDFSFNEQDCKIFENYLNKNLPEFENGMYDRIFVELSGDKQFEIFLHEKTNENINLNMTSSGRRWYFTYYFMKSTLEKGDVFIIDEPAAMLHPLAQKEILKELKELQKQDITVIYSTHSNYLIPNEWDNVHFVLMSEMGTEVSRVENTKDTYKRLREISGNDIFDLQGLYDMFCKSDKQKTAKNCCEILKETFGNFEKASKELNLAEDTIKSWSKPSNDRSPRFENVILIATKTNKTVEELLVV